MTIDQAAIARTRLDGLPPQSVRHVVATANALELGRVDEAERHIMGVLALYPEHPEVLRLLAGIQNLRGDKGGAVSSMRRAVAQRPNDALYHNTLGAVLGQNTEFDAAIAALRKACELQPDLSTSWYNLGLLLMRCVRPEESAYALRRAVELEPDFAYARVMLGEMLRASGHNDEAAEEYRKLIRQQPQTGAAWWGLADLKTGKLGEDDIAAMRQAMLRPDVSDDDLIALGFALAKALDDQKRYGESMAELARTHARARARQQWDAADATRRINSIIRAHSPPLQGAAEPLGGEVIFIASLPRAGSTLTEQILASHSQVFGGGELVDMPQVISEESRRLQQQYPDWVKAATPADWTRIGKRYLERTGHARQGRARFTDKLPNNWHYVGTILAALPNARVVIVRRDPLENCLAVYRQFLANNEYARTFADLASYWRDFDMATKYWLSAYPGRVYENVYEELVADPETKIRELLEFCGLPFEQNCIDFHKTERDVHTPSAAQVRQPIRKDTARAPRYGALLDPLRKELGLPLFDAQSG